MKQLKDLVYFKEQRQQWKKVVKEKRLAWEIEQQRRHDDPKTLEYHTSKVEEKNRHVRAAECEGMTSETWPLRWLEEDNFPPSLCKFDK
jgi:hypothetical protein